MMTRLMNFFRSGNKMILLKYFLSERRYAAELMFSRIPGRWHKGNPSGKVDLTGQLHRMYGLHRSGWSYAIRQLRDLHQPGGAFLDAFVDRTFSGGVKGFKGYERPWIGFIHVPPGVPGWMESKQSNEAIFRTESWQRSLPYCRGLFTLSEYHRLHLEKQFSFPVEALLHPVEFPEITWSFNKFMNNPEKKIVQSGWWLRRVWSLYLLDAGEYRKVLLQKPDAGMEQHMLSELEHRDDRNRITGAVRESVTRMNFLPDPEYDRLLSENIVFLDLVDASANNAVIECIARNTPLLVNPLPAVKEYLGADYPFYFNSLEEASQKAADPALVRAAHEYLVALPLKARLTGDYFMKSFSGSALYRSL